MTRWTTDEYFAYVAKRKRALDNADPAGPVAVVEPGACHGALGTAQEAGGGSPKFLVRVTSRRKRLLDEDNLCAKYHVDCLRYAGIIPTDAPSQTRIEVRQEKVSKGQPEEIVIEVLNHG